MYRPRHFDVTDRAWCHDLIRRESFATLVSVDGDGVPFATHLPVLLDPDRGPLGTLEGHMARPNPQWEGFASGRPVLVVFQGAHAYVSPSWYEVHPSVPTWNYVAVHAYGIPRVIEDRGRVRALLTRQVGTYEGGRPRPWRLEDLADEYVDRMMGGIVALDIPIDRLEGKAKLSQNRGDRDQERVIAALGASGAPLENAVAEMMRERRRSGGNPTD